jgi:hypothetical protein
MTIDSFEERVTAADPSAGVALPRADSAEVRWYYAAALQKGQAARRGSRLRTVFFVAIPAAVACALISGLLISVTGSPTTAAAQILKQAASRAALTSAIPSGQFEYQETQSTYQATLYSPAGSHGELTNIATAQYEETDQTWISSDGGEKRLRSSGPLVFPSSAVQSVWVNNPTGASSLQRIQQANDARDQSAVGPSAVNVSDLPTDEASLASIIANGEMQSNIDMIQSSPNSTFERAAALLLGPAQDMSPELASALFQVLAAQPGVTLVGNTSDRQGRQGQGLELKNADGTAVSEVIVDLARGSLIEANFASPNSTLPSSGAYVCYLGPVGSTTTTYCSSGVGRVVTAPIWTDIVAAGIVSSGSATTTSATTSPPL